MLGHSTHYGDGEDHSPSNCSNKLYQIRFEYRLTVYLVFLCCFRFCIVLVFVFGVKRRCGVNKLQTLEADNVFSFQKEKGQMDSSVLKRSDGVKKRNQQVLFRICIYRQLRPFLRLDIKRM